MVKNEVAEGQVDGKNGALDEDLDEDPKEALKKVITVDVSEAGVLRKKMTVIVPRESIDEALDKEFTDLRADAVVPGFRRGRAPLRLVEKRFGSDVGEQVTTRLVSNAYLAAIEKEDLKVLGDPLIWARVKDKKEKAKEGEATPEKLVDFQTALAHMELPKEGPLEFKCELEVKPEFDLPELDSVPVLRPKVTITDDDVSKQIDRLRALRGHWAPVLDGKVELDDLLICDLKMTVGGEAVKSQENMQLAARPQQIEGVALDDLGQKLKGAKVGDVKTFEGALPDDYEVEAHRGKKAKFQLTINDIKRMELPPMDEAFLSAQGFDDEQEYRGWIRDRLESRLDQEVNRGMRNQVRQYLVDNTKLDLPEGLSARQTERAVLRKMVELQRQGLPSAEIEKHADELRTIARKEVGDDLKLHFILEEIAEMLEVDVSEEEVNAQIAAMAQSYNRRFDRVRDELAKNDGIEMLYLQIRDEKCIDSILEKAKVSEEEGPKKTAAKKKKATKPDNSGDKAKVKAKAEKPSAAKPKATQTGAKKATRKKKTE